MLRTAARVAAPGVPSGTQLRVDIANSATAGEVGGLSYVLAALRRAWWLPALGALLGALPGRRVNRPAAPAAGAGARVFARDFGVFVSTGSDGLGTMSNVCRVWTRKRTLMTAGGALAMSLALPLATAHAYPPGTSLAVAAVSSPIPGKSSNYTVTVGNGLPGCKVTIPVRSNSRTGRIGPDGTATFDVGVSGKSGRYEVETLSCDVKENTSTDIAVTRYRLNGPTTVPSNRSFLVQTRGWLPKTAITFTVLDSSGKVGYAETLRTDSRGDSRNQLGLLDVGAGAVVVTQGSKSMSYPVTVVPAR